MANRKILWIMFVLIFVSGTTLYSQNSTKKVYLPHLGTDLEITAPHTLGANEQFRLNISCSKKLTDFKLAPSKDLEQLMGPVESSTMSTELVNGVAKTETIYTYTYIFETKQYGEFQLPSLILKNNDEEITIASPHIEVVEHPRIPRVAKDTVFVRAIADKENIQLGDSVLLLLKIYTTSSSLELNNVCLDFPYCYFEETKLSAPAKWKVEEYKGKKYYTCPYKQFQVTPLQEGSVQLPKNIFEFKLNTSPKDKNAFDAFFGSVNPTYEKKKTYTNPIIIKVTP